jgi:subtilisin family serine protease
MSKIFKRTFSSVLALTMAVTGCPVAVTSYAADENEKIQGVNENSIVEDNKDIGSADTDYVDGDVIIMYYDSVISSKSFKKPVKSDYSVVEEYSICANDSNTSENSDESKNYDLLNIISSNNMSSKNTELTKNKVIKYALVRSKTDSTKEMIEELSKDQKIISVEPNYKVELNAFDDSYSEHQWSVNYKGQNAFDKDCDINCDYEDFYSTGSDEEKVIAVVDTGVDYTHEDLKNVMWHNPFNDGELEGEYGYDFVNKDDDPIDDDGHGTHCAGVIAADSENGVGIEGIVQDRNFKIMALKVFPDEGSGENWDCVKSYIYINKAMEKGANVVAVSNSWGGGYYSGLLDSLITMVGEKGALSVFAAGNSRRNTDVKKYFPQSSSNKYIVSVAATDERDQLASFSNYGVNTVDLAAPGVNILSTYHKNVFNPSLYNEEELKNNTSVYYSFDNPEMNLVNVFENGSYNLDLAGEGDFPYKLSGQDVTMSFSNKKFAGEAENNHSLCFETSGSNSFNILIPYKVEQSDTPIDVSFYYNLYEKNVRERDKKYAPKVLIRDAYLNDEGGLSRSDYIDYMGEKYSTEDEKEGLERVNCTVMDSNDSETIRFIVIYVQLYDDADYSFYLDSVGVRKENVEETLGKYEWLSGTSMATPHVTAAVGLLADKYPEMPADELKDKLLSCTRKSQSLKGKVMTEGILDFSKIDELSPYVENITVDVKENLVISGENLLDASLYVDGFRIPQIGNSASKIVAKLDDKYRNSEFTIQVVKDDDRIKRTYYYSYGNKYDEKCYYNSELNCEGAMCTSDGKRIIVFNNDKFIIGSVPDDKNEVIEWNNNTSEIDQSFFNHDFEGGVPSAFLSGVGVRDVVYYDNKMLCFCDNLIQKSYNVFSHELFIAGYDIEKDKWYKITDKIYGDYKMTVYNGEVLLVGRGGDVYRLTGNLNYNVTNRNIEMKSTNMEVDSFSESYSNVFVINNKLVVFSYGQDESDNTYYIDKIQICDGDNSRVISNPGIKMYDNPTNRTAVVKDGVIFAGVRTEKIGDTFKYNIENKSVEKLPYKTGFDNYFRTDNYIDAVVATAKDRLFFITEKQIGYISDSISDENYNEFEYANVIEKSIEVETDYVNVRVKKIPGVTVQGEGYYRPQDKVRLVFSKASSKPDEIFVNGNEVHLNINTLSLDYEMIAKDFCKGVDVRYYYNGEEIESADPDEDFYNGVTLSIEGYQINTTFEGHRTVYTVNDPNKVVKEVGMIYGLAGYADEWDMELDSDSEDVYSYVATENGKINYKLNSDNVQAYAMTMKFIKKANYYNAPIMMRAYAKLDNGFYVYSDVFTVSVYDVAYKLYCKRFMPTKEQHDYLYNDILKVCNPDIIRFEY